MKRTFFVLGVLIVAIGVFGAMVAGLVELNTAVLAYASICPPEFPETAYGCPQTAYDPVGDCCYYGTTSKCRPGMDPEIWCCGPPLCK